MTGALSKGSGSFDIPHLVPGKEHMRLRHYFVESNSRGSNIYKYQCDVKSNGTTNECDIELPDYFNYLNENVMIWVNPVDHFGSGYGNIVGGCCCVRASKPGLYYVFIFGDRQDEVAKT